MVMVVEDSAGVYFFFRALGGFDEWCCGTGGRLRQAGAEWPLQLGNVIAILDRVKNRMWPTGMRD